MAENVSVASERRASPRAAVKFLVLYQVDEPIEVRIEIGDRLINAIAINLSTGGMAVLTNYAIPVNTVVNLQFTLFNEQETDPAYRCCTVDIEGEIRYNYFTEEGAYRLGIRFLGMTKVERAFITKFVALAATQFVT